MKLKKILLVISLFLFIIDVKALDCNNIEVAPISEYQKNIFSYNHIEIKNLDTDNGDFIVGSELQIQDIDGNVLVDWKSLDEDQVIQGLDRGTYYLVQLSVDDKYELNSNKIKFEVDNDIIKLEIKNAKKIVVPGTMSSGNTLLAFVAMLNISIGIGIISYVKKNKAKE